MQHECRHELADLTNTGRPRVFCGKCGRAYVPHPDELEDDYEQNRNVRSIRG
jgi:hypothetical protein